MYVLSVCLCCRQAQIGPGQLGLAGGAVLFGLVFLLVSGGDFATTNRYKVGTNCVSRIEAALPEALAA
jgi:hypothetical protein